MQTVGGLKSSGTYRKPALVRRDLLASATALKTLSSQILKDSVG